MFERGLKMKGKPFVKDKDLTPKPFQTPGLRIRRSKRNQKQQNFTPSIFSPGSRNRKKYKGNTIPSISIYCDLSQFILAQI